MSTHSRAVFTGMIVLVVMLIGMIISVNIRVDRLEARMNAQAMSAGTAETEGLRAKPASAFGNADAPNPGNPTHD